MAKAKTVPMKRKRKSRTDYHKRLTLLKSREKRLVVRKSLKNIIVQIIDYAPEGDRVIASADTRELEKYGYKHSKGNIVAAYLTGVLAGRKAKKNNVEKAVFDIGLQQSVKRSRLFAAVKGAVDSGLDVPASEESFPPDERIRGDHIKSYAENLKKDDTAYKKQFSAHLKNNIQPEKITESFEQTKNSIMKE
ncbi:MAG: 50S ribosomal protein L18 [Candidatus Woesearchaeota archaeon]